MDGRRLVEFRARGFALLLTLGAAFMFGRTLVLISGGALVSYTWWSAVLLVVESLIDLFTLVAAGRWLVTNSHMSAALWATVLVVVVHAVRVAIFVLGRTGPWVDFDIRPERRVEYAGSWTWAGVYFAAVMSAVSVMVVVLAWIYWRRWPPSRRAAGAPIDNAE